MDYVTVSDAILEGRFDTYLDVFVEDIQARRNVLGKKRARRAEALPEGTRVELVNVSPKKANGATGRITYDTHNGKIGIRLDYSITNRLRAYSPDLNNAYTWPASCYVEIEDDQPGDES